jgi:hypothetical protein
MLNLSVSLGTVSIYTEQVVIMGREEQVGGWSFTVARTVPCVTYVPVECRRRRQKNKIRR